jgi:hypothetical protein
MRGAILPVPQYVMAWCLVMRRYNFTFCYSSCQKYLEYEGTALARATGALYIQDTPLVIQQVPL